jgi:hypothetical protein
VKLFWLPEESRNGTKPASSFTRRCLHLQVLLETMLPPATPTLGSLVKLGLIGLHLVDLPREVLECLKQLKHFDVSLNEFTRLPVGLKEIPSLEFLNLAGNSKLQFRSSDADLLAAFPGLQVLRLGAQFYPDVAVNEFGSPRSFLSSTCALQKICMLWTFAGTCGPESLMCRIVLSGSGHRPAMQTAQL